MAETDRPKLTWMVRQFDRNPGRGETILTAVAEPSPEALTAENASLARARATGVDTPGNPRPNQPFHRDHYKDMLEATSVDRNYTG